MCFRGVRAWLVVSVLVNSVCSRRGIVGGNSCEHTGVFEGRFYYKQGEKLAIPSPINSEFAQSPTGSDCFSHFLNEKNIDAFLLKSNVVQQAQLA
jgi:hypothetical protein